MADQNKTEKATPRRRQKARERGQVARSRDLVAGIGTMAAVMLLAWQLPAFVGDWRSLLRRNLDLATTHPDQSRIAAGTAVLALCCQPHAEIAAADGRHCLSRGCPAGARLDPASRSFARHRQRADH